MSMNLGWLRDTPDSRDYKYKGLRTVLTSGDIVVPHSVPVRNQVGGSCVANAWCHALEILASNANVEMPRRSGSALYWQSRRIHGAEGFDGGTYIRTAASCLYDNGVGRSDEWPEQSPFNVKPQSSYWMTSFEARLAEYQRINDGDLDAIENALRAKHPVVFGTYVDSAFMQYDGKSDVVFDAPATSLGGHAMVVVGMRGAAAGREWLVLNSWGEDWGMWGTCWFTSNYMQRSMDNWVGLRHPT